jgi:hypothetical protein
MLLPFDCSTLPFIALYAETHFRLARWLPNLLYARQPEVIFDAPRRLDPGEDLPVFLIANDINRFPAEFTDCAVAVSCLHELPRRFDFQNLEKFEVDHPFRRSMRCFIMRIPRNECPRGLFHLNCRVTVKQGKRKYVVFNDNLKGTGKLSFSCFSAESSLPGSEFCCYGDLHMHSQYSQSHVEFGPPLKAIDTIARAIGLSFAAITDHSYDLACSMENYLEPADGRERWQSFQKDLDNGSKENRVILLSGEEISCLNNKKKAVHLCGLGLKEYIPGTIDGARRKRVADLQLTLSEVVDAVHRQNGIAVASHPGEKPGLFQRLLLSRGIWDKLDTLCGLDAMQILNNGFTPSLNKGKRLWINILQRGLKVPLAAGNDAHGDFNRYRALSIPFLAVGENQGRYFGNAKTGIYGKHGTASELLAGIREGSTFITNGPFAAICSSASCGDTVVSNRPVSVNNRELYVHAISTTEFGPLRSIEVYGSENKEPGSPEIIYFKKLYETPRYDGCERLDLALMPGKPLYLRAEVKCTAPRHGGDESAALTSPAYFS